MGVNSLYTELLELLQDHWTGLPDKPEENPEVTLKALWMMAGGTPMSVQRIAGDHLCLPEQVDPSRVRELVTQRIAGAPLAYLTGRQSFLGIEMLAGPEAMIPRRETELLGRAAVQAARELAAQQGEVLAIDLCTGSGNLALALACWVSDIRMYGADINPASVALATRNAAFLGVSERAVFLQGDLFRPLDNHQFWGKVDLITCNPPYSSTRTAESMPREISGFEPRQAFDGGPFGVSVMTRLVKEAPRFLRPGGRLFFEVGLGQGEMMSRIVQKAGMYSKINNLLDENGDIRGISAIV